MRGGLWRGMLGAAIATSLIAVDFGRSRLAWGAEYLQIGLGLLSVTVPIKALETFAETGKTPDELDTYLDYLSAEDREQFRDVLNRQFDVSPVAVSQVTYSSIGEGFLTRLGQIVRTPSGLNGGQAIRAALILAAAEPEGLSLLNILEAFPTVGIRVEVGELLTLQDELSAYFSYRDATMEAIRAQAAQEIATSPAIAAGEDVPDLTTRGRFSFRKTVLQLQNQFPGIAADNPRLFEVDLYIPQDVPARQVPLVVISHGLGSSREEFANMAEHLASYGFAVAVPEHPGSNTTYQEEFLANLSYEGVSPFEFVYRPWDIKTILNALSAEPAYAQMLDLDDVGVIGHSFGGYTALALAGAPLNLERLKASCDPVRYLLNLSTLLQCRAAELPSADYNLADERVRAVMAYSPITSLVLGPEGLAAVDDPVMMVAASSDFIAPPIPEQIHPFIWLDTSDKYLATFNPASHVSINGEIDFPDQVEVSPEVANLLTGPVPELSTAYAYALNVAFMGTYISDRPGYAQLLSPSYAVEFLSEPPIGLQLITRLTEEQLTAAYNDEPPIPIYPEPTSIEE